ncbi:MAG: hypothetical protein ACXWIN_05325 [Burkholderiaceae bacterium]
MRIRLFQSVICLPLITLVGCSAPSGQVAAPQLPEKTAVPGPSSSTVVLNTAYSMDGLILPVMRGQQLTQTRHDMRRTDSSLSFDNRFLRAIAGENQTSDILRLDKKLHWMINTSKKTYRECPLSGCATATAPSSEKPKQEKPAKQSEPNCPLTLKKNDVKVVTSGEHQTINSFNTERIQIKWTMELQDPKKRVTSNHVVLDMWTTPEVGVIKQAKSVDEAFQRNWLTALGGTDHPFNKYVPREVINSMSALMSKNANAFAAWGNELKKVHGYPISTTLTWSAEGNACGDENDQSGNSAKSGSATPTNVSGLLGNLLGGKIKESGKNSTARALLTYTHEVKGIEIKPVSDGFFVPDAGFQKVQ